MDAEMTVLLALKELRDKVSAGTATKRDFILSDLVPHDRAAFRAFSGSIDAAKALHEALLPNWSVALDMTPCDDGWETSVNLWNGMPSIESREVVILDDEATTPACAWLLAILDALISMEAPPMTDAMDDLVDRLRVYADGLTGKNELSVGPHMSCCAMGEAADAIEALQARVLEHDRIVAEKDAEIARLRDALLSGKAFAEDWIAEHGGIDGCDYSDRLAFENMCAALGDTDE